MSRGYARRRVATFAHARAALALQASLIVGPRTQGRSMPVAGPGGTLRPWAPSVEQQLREVLGERVRSDSGTRALFTSDASLYRALPSLVVEPADVDELAAVVRICGETGTPLTMRGAGTSIAGNALGSGVVVTTRRSTASSSWTPTTATPWWSRASCSTTSMPRLHAARPARRPRSVHAQPLHHRRHDRQQRLRLALGRLGHHGAERPGPRRHPLRRLARPADQPWGASTTGRPRLARARRATGR